MYFRYFVIISPWKRAGPFIWTNLNPLDPRMLCAKFGWNWPSGSGEEDENVKSLQTDRQTDRRTDRRTDGQTDDGRQVIRKAHLSFQLRWAKNENVTHLWHFTVYTQFVCCVLRSREEIHKFYFLPQNYIYNIQFHVILPYRCHNKDRPSSFQL